MFRPDKIIKRDKAINRVVMALAGVAMAAAAALVISAESSQSPMLAQGRQLQELQPAR